MRLDGKTVIVTGGASGIGEACCKGFAEAGAAVVVADRDETGGRAVADRLSGAGGRAAFFCVDITSEQACADMVAFAVSQFDGLNCAVNCAGVAHSPTPIHEIDEAVWRRVWEIDALGTAFCMKYEIPRLLEAGGGTIVNIASGAGLHAARGMAAYVSAKHAVVGMTKNAALDLAPHNIRVNAICPGLIATATNNKELPPGMRWEELSPNPTGRVGKPYEVANMAIWLASDLSSFVTGEAIGIDGGRFLG